MDKIKYKYGRNKFNTVKVKSIRNIDIVETVRDNPVFVEFLTHSGKASGFYIGEVGTYLDHNKVKYRTIADFYKLQVLLEKESIYNAVKSLENLAKEKSHA